jgi:energy-converting hydrogenase Eha subunit F
VEMICNVDALAVLPGWETSAGVTVEVALALFLGLPVYSAVSRERIYPTPAPWSRLLHVYGGFR